MLSFAYYLRSNIPQFEYYSIIYNIKGVSSKELMTHLSLRIFSDEL